MSLSPTRAKTQYVTPIDIGENNLVDLLDVTITTPAEGEVLTYSGGVWVNDSAGAEGATTLDGLTDVTITSAATGDFIRYSGSAWVDAPISQLLTDIKTVDGTGSGLDADLLDGNEAAAFSLTAHTHTLDGLSDVAITSPATGAVLTYDGADWVDAVPVTTLYTIPLAADFPTTVLGAGQVNDAPECLTLTADAHGATRNIQQVLQAKPSTPWSRIFKLGPSCINKDYHYGGFCAKDSGTGKIVAWTITWRSGFTDSDPTYFTNATTYSSSPGATLRRNNSNFWMKITDNGTNFISYMSSDGVNFTQQDSFSNTAFFASYDFIGFMVDAFNQGAPNHKATLNVYHYGATFP